MLSINLGLTNDESYSSVVGFSGKIINKNNLLKRMKSKTKMLLLHGDQDEVVNPTNLLEAKDPKILRQTINTNLYLTGSVSDEQLSRLEYIANKCPIHKILHKSFNIELALFIK